MDFVRKVYHDLPQTDTPIMAADVAHLNDGIEEGITKAEAADGKAVAAQTTANASTGRAIAFSIALG